MKPKLDREWCSGKRPHLIDVDITCGRSHVNTISTCIISCLRVHRRPFSLPICAIRGKRELSFWFPRASREPSPAKRASDTPGDPKYDEMMAYMKEKVGQFQHTVYCRLCMHMFLPPLTTLFPLLETAEKRLPRSGSFSLLSLSMLHNST